MRRPGLDGAGLADALPHRLSDILGRCGKESAQIVRKRIALGFQARIARGVTILALLGQGAAMFVDRLHLEGAAPFQEGVFVRGQILEEHVPFVELGDLELVGHVLVGL